MSYRLRRCVLVALYPPSLTFIHTATYRGTTQCTLSCSAHCHPWRVPPRGGGGSVTDARRGTNAYVPKQGAVAWATRVLSQSIIRVIVTLSVCHCHCQLVCDSFAIIVIIIKTHTTHCFSFTLVANCFARRTSRTYKNSIVILLYYYNSNQQQSVDAVCVIAR